MVMTRLSQYYKIYNTNSGVTQISAEKETFIFTVNDEEPPKFSTEIWYSLLQGISIII